MKILKLIRPEKPLKELNWFDIAIVTAIMFGQFIVWSTELFLTSLQPVAQTVTAATVKRLPIQLGMGQHTRATLPCRSSY